MGIFRKKHDISDIYGVRGDRKENLRLPDSPSKRTYNRHYHNYFRGYTEVRQINEKGRVVIQRYYTKPWKVSGLSSRNYWMIRLLYILLTIASAVLYVSAMTQNVPGNRHWVVAIPGMPAVIALFLLVVAVIQYLTVPKKMTIWDHESSTKHIKRASVAAAIILALTALALIGFAAVTQVEVPRTLLCALVDLIAACGSALIYFLERKVPYSEIPNDTLCPSGETHEIR